MGCVGCWLKDKYDYRDYLHAPKAREIPPMADLSNYLTPVRNQGSVGSCTGFGIGINVNSIVKQAGFYTEWQSPTWIYNGARFIAGTLTQDVGAYPGDCLKWMLESGCLLEHFWPYVSDKLDQAPPSSLRMSQAVKYDNFAYYRVVDGVDGICSALADGHFVSIGSPWFSKWNQAPNGVLAQVSNTDAVSGGHETCLFGYDRNEARFMGVNSWGSGWGNSGMYTMPFEAIDVFKYFGGYDAQYITFDAKPIPPTPTPSTCKVGNGVASVLNVYSKVMNRRGRFHYLNED